MPCWRQLWHESLIYPHNIHEVSRTLGNLSHKTGLWPGLFNTASVKWLKEKNTPVRSEKNCSCSCSNCCCIHCKFGRRVKQHCSGWKTFCSPGKMVIGEFCTARRERSFSYYDSVSFQPRSQKWFNGALSCPMRKIRTIFSQTKHLNWKYTKFMKWWGVISCHMSYLLVKDSTAINAKILLNQLAAGCLFKILIMTLEFSS